MLRKFLVMGVAMAVMQQSNAQDSAKSTSLKISGFADVYFRYDFAKTKANNLTSFTNSHGNLNLGMASVKLDYTVSKVQVVADLGVGKRANEFSYNDNNALQAVKQFYISYSPKSWLKFTAGSWGTHVGYEVLDAPANRNYSMSYMFTNGPFSHTGVKAEATSGSSAFMVGISNATDYKYVPDGYINRQFLIAQYAFTPSDYFKAYLNYVGGTNLDTTKTKQFDIVLTSKLSNKFSVGYNGTLNITKEHLGNKVYGADNKWWGSALYVNVDPTASFGLTLRGEYFNDDKQLKVFAAAPAGGSVFATTLSAQIKLDKLVLIPEFRYDKASQPIFVNDKSAAVKSATSLLLAAIYQF